MAANRIGEQSSRSYNSTTVRQACKSCDNNTPRDLLRLIAMPSPDDVAGSSGNPSLRIADFDHLKDEFTDHLISAKQLSQYLQVPISWCWRASRQGLLPHYRCGAYLRYDLAEVLYSLKRPGENRDPRA